MSHPTPGTAVGAQLQQAIDARRQVRATIRFHGEAGPALHERRWDPHHLTAEYVVVFSHLRNEFRTVPLADIVRIEMLERRFTPRRPLARHPGR